MCWTDFTWTFLWYFLGDYYFISKYCSSIEYLCLNIVFMNIYVWRFIKMARVKFCFAMQEYYFARQVVCSSLLCTSDVEIIACLCQVWERFVDNRGHWAYPDPPAYSSCCYLLAGNYSLLLKRVRLRQDNKAQEVHWLTLRPVGFSTCGLRNSEISKTKDVKSPVHASLLTREYFCNQFTFIL